jgi:Ferric reductase like transmembrane component
MPAEAVSLVADARETPSLLSAWSELAGRCWGVRNQEDPVNHATTATVLPRPIPPSRPAASSAEPARRDAAVRLGAGTGLWLSLLLVQVLLMARLPQLERAFGQDQLARHHRVVGFSSFNLMVAHVVLITLGYAAGQLGPAPAAFWDLITDYPGMLLALAGTACVVMTVATSLGAARRRLRYESWHLLHLYAYLGVGLALPHQLWTGQEFLASTAPPSSGGACGRWPPEPSWCGGSASRCGATPGTGCMSPRSCPRPLGSSRCT